MRNDTLEKDPQRQLFFARLADALQVAAMTANRLAVTAKQQAADAGLCLNAVERAIAELKAERGREREASAPRRSLRERVADLNGGPLRE